MPYERPEILEVGQAQTLTLGTTGVNTDACGCSVPRAPSQTLPGVD